MEKIFDLYNLIARQFPATITLSPIIVAAFATFPDLRNLAGFIGGVIVVLGLPAVLAYLVRGPGRLLEIKLYKQWGGKPSMAMLRHRDDRIKPETKGRYHRFLRSKAKIPIPTKAEEKRDRSKADEIYDSASDWLRRAGRDSSKHKLIHAENIGYGFARNLLALKPFGIAIAFLAAALQIGIVVYQYSEWSEFSDMSVPIAASGFFSLALLLLWIFAIRPEWVRLQAEGYARALLEVCDGEL